MTSSGSNPEARLYRRPSSRPASQRSALPQINVDTARSSSSARRPDGPGIATLDSPERDRSTRPASWPGRQCPGGAQPPGGEKLACGRRRSRGEPAGAWSPGRKRRRRLAPRNGIPAAGRDRRRQRQLDQLARPGESRSRRQGVRQSRRRREGRHLHRLRADEPGAADGGGHPQEFALAAGSGQSDHQPRPAPRRHSPQPDLAGGRGRREGMPTSAGSSSRISRSPRASRARNSRPNIDAPILRVAMV